VCLLAVTLGWSPPARALPTQASSNACEIERYASGSSGVSAQSFRFAAEPKVSLGGCLYRPVGRDRFPVVILVTGSGDGPTAAGYLSVTLANTLAARRVGVFAFNKRGTGDSGGRRTGSDFAQRGRDVAAAVRFVKSLPGTTAVGLWGISQAGWVIPQSLRPNDGVAFVVLVSPAGVNPNDQMSYFIRRLALDLGLAPGDADKAEVLHRTVVRYHATGEGYAAAEALVQRDREEAWFERFRSNTTWNERIPTDGRLLTPEALKRAWNEHPGAWEFFRAPSTFADYRPIYQGIDRPTLIVQGSADSLVPYKDSNAAFAAGFARSGNRAVTFKVYEGADHGIFDGGMMRPAYLDFVTSWMSERFLAGPAR
jgi:alpha-beta hydrolase superfamily lysophospholipase